MSGNTIMVIGIILILLTGGVGIAIAIAESEENSACAYCQNTISEHADTVICTDGRRYHAECYLRYIEEKQDGKQS